MNKDHSHIFKLLLGVLLLAAIVLALGREEQVVNERSEPTAMPVVVIVKPTFVPTAIPPTRVPTIVGQSNLCYDDQPFENRCVTTNDWDCGAYGWAWVNECADLPSRCEWIIKQFGKTSQRNSDCN